MIISTATYSTDGNRLVSTTDAAGNVTTYSYNANTNILEWVQYPEDTAATRTEYTYDTMYRLASAEATTDTGSTLTASYTYSDDLLTKIETGSTTYSFSYGTFALRSSIQIGSHTLASYSYTSDGNNYLEKLAYGNGDSVKYTYDDQGRVTQQTYYEDGKTTVDATVTYKYDNNGALATVTDSDTGITTTYYYDFTERLMKYVESDGTNTHSVSYEYDTINNLTSLVETINGTSHTTSYEYDMDNRITSVTNDSTVKSYTYDAYSRVSEQVIKNGSTEVLTTSYAYRNPTDTTTTGQVSTLTIDAGSFNVAYTYTYDDNGNILSVSDGTYTTSYVYDTAGQLLRENNQAAGKTWVWTYDNAGNIKTRKEYAYTTGTVGTATDTVTYTYGDSSWGDLLTAYDGVAITYDDIGNPLTDCTWTYTWEHGRELASMTDGSTTWTYTYDANGMRTSRSNGTTTYKYVYNGSSLVQMTVGSNTLYFTSDTVTLNGTTYYYVTNLQGDIVAILNSGGTAIVQYTYDAWGNILSMSDTSGVSLGTLNPLRYRGYVYDQESGLYYLQSRYYDPELGRFLNADTFASTGQGLRGSNMFVYCLNCPTMGLDFSGERTYFINGISNDEEKDSPDYAYDLEEKLEELGVDDVIAIPVYNGQATFWGTVYGAFQVVLEMLNVDIYTTMIVAAIEADLKANPLAEGETINLIGYSGGGQLALNVMEAMEGQVDNVVLIGTPIAEMWKSTTKVHMIYSTIDPLSWNVGSGYSLYCVGAVGHTAYFSKDNIDAVAQQIYTILK